MGRMTNEPTPKQRRQINDIERDYALRGITGFTAVPGNNGDYIYGADNNGYLLQGTIDRNGKITPNTSGVPMKQLQSFAKIIQRSHRRR